MSGWEWLAPDGGRECGALAEDRNTGRRVACRLRGGHESQEHHWERVEGNQLLSATWIADGPVTYIGGDGIEGRA